MILVPYKLKIMFSQPLFLSICKHLISNVFFFAQNKVIMGIGLAALLGSMAYIAYMRKKYEGMGYYSAIAEDGQEVFTKKKSRWES